MSDERNERSERNFSGGEGGGDRNSSAAGAGGSLPPSERRPVSARCSSADPTSRADRRAATHEALEGDLGAGLREREVARAKSCDQPRTEHRGGEVIQRRL